MTMPPLFTRLCRYLMSLSVIVMLAMLLLASLAGCGKIEGIDEAAKNGDLERVKTLLKENPNLISWKNENGEVPLFLAAVNGHVDVVQLLLSQKADVNDRDGYGMTPLHGVLSHYEEDSNDLHIVELLLANGADVNARNNDDMTPLYFVADNEDWNDSANEIAKLLIANKANVNFADPIVRWTLLHLAASDDHKEIAKLLLANGADVNAKADDGRTPLHVAAQMGHKDMAELLLANGADVNAETTNGLTPLDLAAKNEYKDVVKYLRDHGGH